MFMFYLCISGLPWFPIRPTKICSRTQVRPLVYPLSNLPIMLTLHSMHRTAWEGFLSWPGKSSFMLAFLQLTFRSNFSVLVGPINHIKYLVSKERLAFPVVYFSSLARGKHHLMFPNVRHDVCPSIPAWLTVGRHRPGLSCSPWFPSDHADPMLRSSLWWPPYSHIS